MVRLFQEGSRKWRGPTILRVRVSLLRNQLCLDRGDLGGGGEVSQDFSSSVTPSISPPLLSPGPKAKRQSLTAQASWSWAAELSETDGQI